MRHAGAPRCRLAMADVLISGLRGTTARPGGIPAEVLSKRSETTEGFANPDGTFTLKEHLRPIWAKTADGSWARPDAMLRRRGDGSIAPVASTFLMTFSGGGTAPFATAAREGKELTLGWPGQLPAPALNGNVATYAEVLPGVDLEVHAEVDGFTHVLVVKDRAAAANPALRKLALSTTTKGLTLAVDPATGAVSAKDDQGKLVLGGATPTMWDSGSGSRERAIGAAAQPGVLELVPDATLLTGPDVTYPVRIDPSFTGRRNHWTILRKESGGISYYDRLTLDADDPVEGVLRVGRNNVGNTARTLLELDTSGVAGKHIFSAKLTLWHTWSGKGCGNGNPFSLANVNVHPANPLNDETTRNNYGEGWRSALSGDSGYLRRYKRCRGLPEGRTPGVRRDAPRLADREAPKRGCKNNGDRGRDRQCGRPPHRSQRVGLPHWAPAGRGPGHRVRPGTPHLVGVVVDERDVVDAPDGDLAHGLPVTACPDADAFCDNPGYTEGILALNLVKREEFDMALLRDIQCEMSDVCRKASPS